MPVGEFCNREVVVVGKDAGIAEAVRLMRDHHVGDLVVVELRGEQRIPVGILTDRDIVMEVLAEEVDPATVSVGDLMSIELYTAREDEELLDVIARMRTHGVRRMPVVNAQQSLVGILTVDDVIELLAEQVNALAGLIRRERTREQKTRP